MVLPMWGLGGGGFPIRGALQEASVLTPRDIVSLIRPSPAPSALVFSDYNIFSGAAASAVTVA